jgi:DNA processing protein
MDAADAARGGDDLACWLRLAHTPGVGGGAARALLAAFGLPENIFCAGFDALRAVVAAPVALALSGPVPGLTEALIATTLAWLQVPGNHVLTLADAAYPAALLQIVDPPLLLYLKGRLGLLSRPALAVVGSRNASAQGGANAEHFSHALSSAGLTIVSGLALGIDAAAHRGALRGAGSTIAVIGTGADIVYPYSNRALADLIAEQGCIVSEYALGMPALPANFPRRNRLISGLARAVLVVEAAARSGSLITARMAGEQGRDVFAIPGSIHSALAKGCHALIKQGAKLVESADDVLVEMQLPRSGSVAPAAGRESGAQSAPLDLAQQALLTALGHDPVDLDSLARRAGLDVAGVLAQLLTLELAGLVERLPGGLIQRNHPGDN